MAVTVKTAVLWRRELENQPGTLAEALKPFADEKVNLQVVMGYVLPGDRARAALEVYPVSGKKAAGAASAAGMVPMETTHALLVEGDDRVGLGHHMSAALAQENVNIHFAIIQVVGKRFTGVFGFDNAEAASKAAKVIKAVAGAAAKKAAPKKKAAARVAKKAAPRKKVAAKKAASKKKPAPRKAARKPAARAKAGSRKAAKKPARRARRK